MTSGLSSTGEALPIEEEWDFLTSDGRWYHAEKIGNQVIHMPSFHLPCASLLICYRTSLFF
jgi:hypothetical protein